jgi:hypothetical protein
MRKLMVLMAALLLLLGLPVSASKADVVEIDIAGWETHAGFGDALNSEVFLDIGVGSIVTGFEWVNLSFTTFNGSWLSEFTLSVNNSDASEYLDWRPSTAGNSGIYGPDSGSWGGATGTAGPFGAGSAFVVADGTLWVTIYESFNDPGGIDARVGNGSTLRVFYTAVPEPTSGLLIGMALVGTVVSSRRRR